MPDPASVKGVFASIAPRYDLANRFISCGQDLRMRRRLVRMVAARGPVDVVDLATGSGDLAFALAAALQGGATIRALDFCEPMLDVARAKQAERPGTERVKFAFGDCMALDLPDACADVVTIGWGLRNFEDRARGLGEMRRILRPGGALYCLEFSQPYACVRFPYYLYLRHIVPILARIITGRRDAYDYLAGTVAAFPGREELARQMREAGFSSVRVFPEMFSTIAIHEAVR